MTKQRTYWLTPEYARQWMRSLTAGPECQKHSDVTSLMAEFMGRVNIRILVTEGAPNLEVRLPSG